MKSRVTLHTPACGAAVGRAYLAVLLVFSASTLFGQAVSVPATTSGRAVAKSEDKKGDTVAQPPDRPKNEETIAVPVKLGRFEVMESKILNMDIKRSRDDAQPYAIFERQAIEQSGATMLDDFLKNNVTMNNTGILNSQLVGQNTGSTSVVNLRGLGANQTLILIDGRRAASANNQGFPVQPDINGIPLAAIERIEVLPTTASGIYGGSATGG
ncbi:MAG: TonB-dependent receptor, partial [Opitutaceae bacterium]